MLALHVVGAYEYMLDALVNVTHINRITPCARDPKERDTANKQETGKGFIRRKIHFLTPLFLTAFVHTSLENTLLQLPKILTVYSTFVCPAAYIVLVYRRIITYIYTY